MTLPGEGRAGGRINEGVCMVSLRTYRRLALAGSASLILSGCSSDGLAPPQPVGQVSAKHIHIRSTRMADADRQLIGRVDGRQTAYAAPSPGEHAESMDFLNTPNLAGYDSPRRQKRLPKIDEEAPDMQTETMEPQPEPQQASAAPPGQYVIPPGGVNIDAALGIGQPAAPVNPVRSASSAMTAPPASAPQISRVAPATMAIPEGESAQPVVGGIGTDNPALLRPEAGFDMPDPMVTGTNPRPARR
ncbi:hypothetical protein [Rhizobium halophytocola]|uniref:Lipoprotein n=1 Tax=Rhizobium halophytocola TaxID=735519 RepID=A0ABS4DZS7_9HYPH|nr:hypothetical protein [Rhizobium halophytocola]MBP1851201.1 hypothetical protein [Rhizobium halophytocola]